LEGALDKCRATNSNLVILTLPGLGGTHLFKSYWGKHKDGEKVAYIDDENGNPSEFNLLNLSLDRNPMAMTLVEDYVKKAGLNNKFAVLIHKPSLVETKEYKGSFLANHVYEYYYLGTRSKEDVALIVGEINPDLGKAEIEEIYNLSGGIAQLVKYLTINWQQKPNFDEKSIENILEPINMVIFETKTEDLRKLGILDEENQPRSSILRDKIKMKKEIDISINFDLS